MKRFIDLTDQINDDEKLFAFYCTVKDCFESFSGSQTWDSIEGFKADYSGLELDRYLKLIPNNFFSVENSWADFKLLFMGQEIKDVSHITYPTVNAEQAKELLKQMSIDISKSNKG